MKIRNSTPIVVQDVDWSDVLASISDKDLDLLISANTKMGNKEAVLTRQELEAFVRWQPHLDSVSIGSQS